MLEFQALKLPYHSIAIRLKIISCKKFDAAPELTGGQKPSESLHWLLKIMILIEAAQALTYLFQHILNTFISWRSRQL